MKALSQNLRPFLHRPATQARIYTELLVAYNEDQKATQAQQDTGSKSNVTTYPDGRVTLTPSNVAKISHTAGTDFLTDYLEGGPVAGSIPLRILWWRLDDSIGADADLRKVECYLTRRRVGANAAFDGDFVMHFWRLETAGTWSDGTDYWNIRKLSDEITVPASSMSADSALTAFEFGLPRTPARFALGPLTLVNQMPSTTPDSLEFVGRRVIGISIEVVGGSNDNYGWLSESGHSADKEVGGAGKLHHRLGELTFFEAPRGGVGSAFAAAAATGMPRATFTLGSYPASGSITFDGADQLDLGAAVQGEVEFVVRGQAPQGTTLIAEASDDAGANWSVVTDGCTPAEAVPPLSSQQTYEMRWLFTTNATTDASPTARELGILDRVIHDRSEIATWEGEQRGVDPLTMQYRLATATVRLQLVGERDYQDLERLLATNNPARWQVRKLWGHPSLARAHWLVQDLYDVDDYEITETEVLLHLIGVANRLKGAYPAQTNDLTGFICKAAVSDLSGGANFTRELAEGTESAGAIVVSVAGSATEVDYFITPVSVPNLYWWPQGDWTVKVRIPAAGGNANIHLKVRVTQIQFDGTVVKSTEYTEEQNITASSTTYVFTIRNVAWDAAAVATHRLRIDISARNANGGAQSYTIETGTTNSEVVAPWSYRTDREPKIYSAQTVAAVYADWQSGVVGVPSRYLGPGPDASSDRISKNILNADGLEELCRIAATVGGSVCESQGRVKFIELHRPTAFVVADFPMEEYAPGRVSQGFKDRLPKFRISYDWDGGKFAGAFEVQHVAALAAYGVAKVGDAGRFELDAEIAKYFLGSKRPAELAREIVGTFALGEITGEVQPIIPHPELDLGDGVAFATDRFAVLDPVTGEGIRGPVWAIGRIIGSWGKNPDGFLVLVRGVASLFQVAGSAQKHEPFEPVQVMPLDRTPPDRLDVASISFNVFPAGAVVRYFYRATTTDTPDPASELWSTYTEGTLVELLRDQSEVKYLDYYATSNGVQSSIRSIPITHDKTATIGTLTATEPTGGTVVRWLAGEIDGDTREIRWYIRRNAASGVYPTVSGAADGVLDETYLIGQWPIAADRGGRLYAEQGSYGAGDDSSVIAVPIDYNGNPGTRKNATYAYTGAVTRAPATVAWALNTGGSASVERTFDHSWGAGTMLATDDLEIYVVVDGIEYLAASETTDPTSTLSKTDVGLGEADGVAFFPENSEPFHGYYFIWKLRVAGIVANSGEVSPPSGEYLKGQLLV